MSLLSKIIPLPFQLASDCILHPPTERDRFGNGHFSAQSLSLTETKFPNCCIVFKSRLKQEERWVPAVWGWGESCECFLGKGRAISIPQPADSAYYCLIYTTLASLTWAMSLLDNNAGCSWPLRGEGRSEGGAQGHSKTIAFILHRAALAAGLIPSPPSANLLLCKAESSHNQTTSAFMEIFFVNKETKTVSLSRRWGCATTCLAVLIWDGSSSQGVFAEERLCLEGHWIWMWFCVHRSQCHF